ncbi:hypothetical protein BDK51DRAFT_30206, partial [Blyttiomyces helicus]
MATESPTVEAETTETAPPAPAAEVPEKRKRGRPPKNASTSAKPAAIPAPKKVAQASDAAGEEVPEDKKYDTEKETDDVQGVEEKELAADKKGDDEEDGEEEDKSKTPAKRQKRAPAADADEEEADAAASSSRSQRVRKSIDRLTTVSNEIASKKKIETPAGTGDALKDIAPILQSIAARKGSDEVLCGLHTLIWGRAS